MTNPPDAESLSWLRVALAFAVVFALLAGLGFALKYMQARGWLPLGARVGPGKRLSIVESFPLDVRRRLVIVRCDGAEHLVLLGVGQDIVIEKNLNNAPAADV